MILDLFALGLIILGFAVVIGAMVIRHGQPGDICLVCQESAVFKQNGEYCCLACGAFQNYELETIS